MSVRTACGRAGPGTTAVVLVAVALTAGPSSADSSVPPGSTVLIAGGSYGDGLPAVRATLELPSGIAVGAGGVVVSDWMHHQVRVVGADGVIRRTAGTIEGSSGDGGPALGSELNRTQGIAFDGRGNLYVADAGNNRIRKVDTETGEITTIAGNGERTYGGDGGPATEASLAFPHDVAVGPDGSVYVADYENARVRRVAPDGTISTFAGNGLGAPGVDGVPADASAIDLPTGVALDAAGNVYVADEGNCSIRRVDASTRIISTVAGNGTCGDYTGEGGPATAARLGMPSGVEVDATGRIWIADPGWLEDGFVYHVVGRVHVVGTDGIIRTVAGNGSGSCTSGPRVATEAALGSPRAIALDGSGNAYIAADGCNRVYRLDPEGTLTPFAGNGTEVAGGPGDPATSVGLSLAMSVAYGPSGQAFFADPSHVWTVASDGTLRLVAGSDEREDVDGPVDEARFEYIFGLDVDPAGNLLVLDRGAYKVKRVADGIVTTVAGNGQPGTTKNADGPALEVPLYNPEDIASATDGSIYVSEGGTSGKVRVIEDGSVRTLNAGYTTAFEGDGGPVSLARFGQLDGLGVGPDGSLYVADDGNRRIRKVGPDGIVTTVAGDGGVGDRGDGSLAEMASVDNPTDVDADASGNVFFSENAPYAVIRQVSPSGMISRVAGTGHQSWDPWAPPVAPSLEAPLFAPANLVVTPEGLLVGDMAAIRLVTAPAGGWPDPPRRTVCEPFVRDATGDAHMKPLGFNVTGPYKASFDVVSADLHAAAGNLTATLDVADLPEQPAVPPGEELGTANAWIYVFRVGWGPSAPHRYLAAVSPVTSRDVGTSTVHYELGDASRGSSEVWNLTKTANATGMYDAAGDRITITAPLSDLGLAQPGTVVAYHEAVAGSLFDGALFQFVVWDDAGKSFRNYRPDRNCPEDL